MAKRNSLIFDTSSFHPGFTEHIWPNLWDHQQQAIIEIQEYISSDKENWRNSKLIALPTGSGKAGIIATISRFLKTEGIILVLTPRRELRTQLSADMCGKYRARNYNETGRFFQNAKINLTEEGENKLPKHVLKISKIKELIESKNSNTDWRLDKNQSGQFVLVTTIQLLTYLLTNSGYFDSRTLYTNIDESLRKKYRSVVDDLMEATSLIIFDEGHYEPAPIWSDVVRSFNSPKLIFTATPFRNDLRAFDWDTTNVMHISFNDMVNKYQRIRGIKIEDLGYRTGNLKKVFLEIERKRLDLEAEFGEDVEVIVRVGSRVRILEVTRVISDLGFEYMAVHTRDVKESKAGDGIKLHRNYPIDYKKKVTYWIHQKKLLEGIDRPQISILVILDRLGNMRALVQQIGRLTRRNCKGHNRPYALVLDPTGEVRQQWQRFLEFEESLVKFGFKQRTAEELVNKIFDGYINESLISPIYANGWPKDVLIPQKKTNSGENSHNENREIDGPWDSIFKLDYRKDLIVNTKAQVLEIIGDCEANWPEIINDAISTAKKKFDRIWRVLPTNKANGEVEGLDSKILTLLGISANASPHLRSHAFYDLKLEVLLLYRTDPFVFIFDSTGTNNRAISKYLDYGKPKTLLHQLKQFNDQEIRSVSLLSSRQGKGIIASQTLNSVDLTSIPASLSDPTQIISAARGFALYEDEDVRLRFKDTKTEEEIMHPTIPFGRRVGVSRRRISDYGGMISIEGYCEWAEVMAENMRILEKKPKKLNKLSGKNVAVAKYFNRFAPESKNPPKKWNPKWLYINIARFEKEYINVRNGNSFPVLLDSLIEIKSIDNKFVGVVRVNGPEKRTFKIQVNYNERTAKYVLVSEELDNYRPANDTVGQTILQVLNNENAFSILPEDRNYFYSMGAFYIPGIKFGKSYDDSKTGILETVIAVPGLGKIETEKGNPSDFTQESKNWPDHSLFGIIDAAAKGESRIRSLSKSYFRSTAKELKKFLGDVEWFVCDDMGTERADFLALTQKNGQRYIILIHAKAESKQRYLSATKISDVCMQAIKNLDFLGPRISDHTRDWESKWKKGDGRLDRIRKSPNNLPEDIKSDIHLLKTRAEEDFEKAINNPSVLREVWLVTGQILQRSKLEELLRSENPSFREIPIVYTLFSSMSIIASSPARLRVFCY